MPALLRQNESHGQAAAERRPACVSHGRSICSAVQSIFVNMYSCCLLEQNKLACPAVYWWALLVRFRLSLKGRQCAGYPTTEATNMLDSTVHPQGLDACSLVPGQQLRSPSSGSEAPEQHCSLGLCRRLCAATKQLLPHQAATAVHTLNA